MNFKDKKFLMRIFLIQAPRGKTRRAFLGDFGRPLGGKEDGARFNWDGIKVCESNAADKTWLDH
jgi:hypothetical protein